MGIIFVAGSYGVGKSTLCNALSKILSIPTYSAGDLISNVNGEQYGVNKAVKDKYANQEILVFEIEKKLEHCPTILLAGHFCIFDKFNCVDKLPHSAFEKMAIEQILLLEANPARILNNLIVRDKKKYELRDIKLLLEEERRAAEEISHKCRCSFHIHHMAFDESDIRKCCKLLNEEVQVV